MLDSIHDNLRCRYNPDGSELRQLQLRMLEILIEVDAICKRHNIKYWLSSGTLLGAVRHGGFIPWDDDLDIEIMREDYTRLMTILPKELPAHLALQTDQTDANYVYLYSKVRDMNSYIKEECVVNQRLKHQGAFVDIFPMETAPHILCGISAKLFNRLCLKQAIEHGCHTALYKWARTFLLSVLFPLFRIISKGYKKAKIHHTYGVNFLIPVNVEDVFPLTTVDFEGHSFPAPQSSDKYLTALYRDYMKIPEEIVYHRVENSIHVW